MVTDDDGTVVRIVCGSFWGRKGSRRRRRDRSHLISMCPCRRGRGARCRSPPLATLSRTFAGDSGLRRRDHPLAVPTEAERWDDAWPPATAENRTLVLLERGDHVTVKAGDEGVRFLLVSGRPIEEPVAWYGPIVMNTQAELREAFDEIERGPFRRGGRGHVQCHALPAAQPPARVWPGAALRASSPMRRSRSRPAGSRQARVRLSMLRRCGDFDAASYDGDVEESAGIPAPAARVPAPGR